MRSMTAREYDNWRRYAALFPIGDHRSDLQTGIIASTIANVNRAKGADPFTPDDFMPEFGKEPEPEMTEEQIETIERWQARARALDTSA